MCQAPLWRVALGLAVLLASVLAGCARAPAPTFEAHPQAQRVTILRDEWGVPHVFGHSDADTAFGLAYAHAEDDFRTIQLALVAARGRLGELLGTEGARNDYFVRAFRVWETVEAGYERDLSPAFRRLVEGYAAGLTYYAERHPEEWILADLLPFLGRDIVAGFVHKLPLFLGVDQAIQAAAAEAGTPRAGESASLSPPLLGDASLFGSNAFAAGPDRSGDGRTRLAVNSHQPYEGPVAWYEAQLVSEEGWNAIGGLFPGAPIVLHGHNDRLGWAHTVNRADFVDVYRLETHPDHPDRYRLDGEWREFEKGEARLRVRLFGWIPWTLTRALRWSVHGPVLELGEGERRGLYAFRVVGAGEVRHAEQWWRMNKAGSLAEWLDAMRMQALPMFNTVYADVEGNIFYVYNALLPLRPTGFDWSGVVAGDTSAALWSETLPFDTLPQVRNPAAGFVLNANSTPFGSTVGPEVPDPARFDPSLGVETRETDRSVRLRALLDDRSLLDDASFDAIKWDRSLPAQGWAASALTRILDEEAPPGLEEAQSVLRRWDGEFAPDSREASLALQVLGPLFDARKERRAQPDPWTLLRRGAARLQSGFGRLDPRLGELQRLRRGGAVDLPLGGGPDVLNATHARRAEDGRLVGEGGDCFVLLATFGPEGVRSRAVSVYGASSRPGSPHFADQAPLFVERRTRPLWRTPEEIRAHLEAEYHPGEEP